MLFKEKKYIKHYKFPIYIPIKIFMTGVLHKLTFKSYNAMFYPWEAFGHEEQKQVENEKDASATNATSSQRHQFAGHQSWKR